MKRNRLALTVMLVALFCFCAFGTSYAQAPQLKAEYYHIKDFAFKSGEKIKDLKIEYATFGTPQKDAKGNITNAVLICHGFSGSYKNPRFIAAMVGPDKPLDPRKYFFITSTAIGSPGSSCPSVSGLGPKFPEYTVADMVAAQYPLLTKHLKIKHLKGVTGPSMGGFQTLQWISTYPDFVDWAIAAASATKTAGRLLGRSLVLIETIKLDPAYKDGYYKEQPQKGMGVYFRSAYLWYFSSGFYGAKWKTKDALIKGLGNIGISAAKVDANDTIWRERALTNYDVSAGLKNVKARTLILGINQDELFPPASVEELAKSIPGAKLFRYDSKFGHLGCALDIAKAYGAINEFLK